MAGSSTPITTSESFSPFLRFGDVPTLESAIGHIVSSDTAEFKEIANTLTLGDTASQSLLLLVIALHHENNETKTILKQMSAHLADTISILKSQGQSIIGLQTASRPQPPPAHSPKKNPTSYANAAAGANSTPPPAPKAKNYLGHPLSLRNSPWSPNQLMFFQDRGGWGRWFMDWVQGPFFQLHADQNAAATLASTTKGKNTSPPPPPKNSRKNPSPLPAALRRFYASRNTPEPITDSDKWTASLPLSITSLLASENAAVSKALSVTINDKGSVSVTASPFQPAAEFTPFLALLTDHLNSTLPVGSNKFDTFRLAPTTVDFVIHALPLHILPLAQEDLSAKMKEAIRYSSQETVEIISARYLIPDPEKRTKNTSSVVIAVSLDDSSKIPSSFNLFSRSRKCERMSNASPATQCRNCCEFGHSAVRCKQEFPSCPLCNLRHTRNNHRCPNSGCAKGGNTRPVAGCCGASPLHCVKNHKSEAS